ncbi:MAG: hypothetical protein JU82_08950 [Sulfuricurvum sp. MLSB]|nr:MAG: hypothetical protein JU82_08950 [Sulfuricurvum sp. MLSB]
MLIKLSCECRHTVLVFQIHSGEVIRETLTFIHEQVLLTILENTLWMKGTHDDPFTQTILSNPQ